MKSSDNHPIQTQPAQPRANIRLSSDGGGESSDVPREGAVKTRKKLTKLALPMGYPCQPFRREPDFGVTSVNYGLAELLARAAEPA